MIVLSSGPGVHPITRLRRRTQTAAKCETRWRRASFTSVTQFIWARATIALDALRWPPREATIV